MTLLGLVLSVGIAAFSSIALGFFVWAGREQRLLDEYKQRDL